MKKNNDFGFTLIELMIVVAIIGILASISIPYFNTYRMKGYNAAAISDLKNLATTEAAFYANDNTYAYTDTIIRNRVILWGKGFPITKGYLAGLNLAGSHPMITASNQVMLVANAVPNLFVEYTIIAKHLQSDKVYVSESDFPGIFYTKKIITGEIGVALTRTLSLRIAATTKQDTRSKSIYARIP